MERHERGVGPGEKDDRRAGKKQSKHFIEWLW